MKVHLRQRKQTKSGSISLYLEIYKGATTTPVGKTKNLRGYEYLNLYLIDKPKTPIDKQHNKNTFELAESTKAKKTSGLPLSSSSVSSYFSKFRACLKEAVKKK